MVNPKNTVVLICGLTADPELVNDGKIANLRVALDWAGRDSENSDDRRGFFDVTSFYDANDHNSTFLFKQISEGKMKKGSQVVVTGSLSNDRFLDKDGNKRQRVVIHANAVTYVGSANRTEGTDSTTDAPSTSSASSTSSESVIPDKF